MTCAWLIQRISFTHNAVHRVCKQDRGKRTNHGVLFHGVPLDYLKWSTLKNNLGVKENDFSKLESHFNARTLLRTFIYQLKRYLLR